jgi:hypothetical protein
MVRSLSLFFVLFLCYANFSWAVQDENNAPDPKSYRYLIRHGADCRLIYQNDSTILKTYPKARIRLLPLTKIRYLVLDSEAGEPQRIVLRGTKDWASLLLDAQFIKAEDHNGAEFHSGFLKVAREFVNLEQSNLNPEVPVIISGHSLGGSSGIIIGAFLQESGFQIQEIVTFGHPRLTNTKGTQRLSDLPVIRVINSTDPVPFLPPKFIGYRHFGKVVVLKGSESFAVYKNQAAFSSKTKFRQSEKSARRIWNFQQSQMQAQSEMKNLWPDGFGRHGTRHYLKFMISLFL